MVLCYLPLGKSFRFRHRMADRFSRTLSQLLHSAAQPLPLAIVGWILHPSEGNRQGGVRKRKVTPPFGRKKYTCTKVIPTYSRQKRGDLSHSFSPWCWLRLSITSFPSHLSIVPSTYIPTFFQLHQISQTDQFSNKSKAKKQWPPQNSTPSSTAASSNKQTTATAASFAASASRSPSKSPSTPMWPSTMPVS